MPSRPSLQTALVAVAAVALGAAINAANGALAPDALAALDVACAAAFLALLCASPDGRGLRRRADEKWLSLLLVAALAYEVGFILVTPPLLYGRLRPGDLPAFWRAISAAAVFSSAFAFAPRGARRILVAALLTLHTAVGLWALRASPAPHIDVYYFQRDGCAAFLQGINPYTITFPNIYGDKTPFYGSHLSLHGRLQFGFIYPPLSLLFALPGHLLGDFRYSQLFAIEAAAALMAFARDSPIAPMAAALYLLTPRSFFVLEQGWTEPYAVFLLAATVFAACRAPRALPYVLGLLLCVKQYLVLAVAPCALLSPWRYPGGLRAFALRAVSMGAAATLPLALWDPHAFWSDVVDFQLRQPLRLDALSYLPWLSHGGAAPLPAWFSFAVAAGTTIFVLWRAPRSPAGFAAAVGVIFLAFFATSKQAFANYYFFVIGAMCCAVSAQPLAAPLGESNGSGSVFPSPPANKVRPERTR